MPPAGPLPNRGNHTVDRAVAAAHVAVIGVGGLGCPAALGLTTGGVGTITLVDPDRVEISNLPRQLLHSQSDIGRPKVESAADSLCRLQPRLQVHRRALAFDRHNAAELLDGVDLAIDATDGLAAKLAINDAAIARRTPFVHAGAVAFGGQVMLVVAGETPCLRCLFPAAGASEDEPATCRQAGIIGPVVGLFGALQATLALAHLRGERHSAGVLISYDRRSDRWRRLDLSSTRRCGRCSAADDDAAGERRTARDTTGP